MLISLTPAHLYTAHAAYIPLRHCLHVTAYATLPTFSMKKKKKKKECSFYPPLLNNVVITISCFNDMILRLHDAREHRWYIEPGVSTWSMFQNDRCWSIFCVTFCTRNIFVCVFISISHRVQCRVVVDLLIISCSHSIIKRGFTRLRRRARCICTIFVIHHFTVFAHALSRCAVFCAAHLAHNATPRAVMAQRICCNICTRMCRRVLDCNLCHRSCLCARCYRTLYHDATLLSIDGR